MDTDLDKQEAIITDINALFTRSISAQEDVGGTHIKFTTSTNHNIVVGDGAFIYDTMNDDNVITDFNEYNPLGKTKPTVTEITADTFTVAGTYESGYDISNAKVKTVKVYNNELQEFVKPLLIDFPIMILNVFGTDVKKTANNHYLPVESEFAFKVDEAVQKYGAGANTAIKACRKFVSDKFALVTSSLKLEIKNDRIERDEEIFNVNTSFKSCVLLK
jgi:hypothetical protein